MVSRSSASLPSAGPSVCIAALPSQTGSSPSVARKIVAVPERPESGIPATLKVGRCRLKTRSPLSSCGTLTSPCAGATAFFSGVERQRRRQHVQSRRHCHRRGSRASMIPHIEQIRRWMESHICTFMPRSNTSFVGDDSGLLLPPLRSLRSPRVGINIDVRRFGGNRLESMDAIRLRPPRWTSGRVVAARL
jgi:hypothetical protein